MKLTNLRPMLYTRDISGTIEFYTRVLGFACDNTMEEWASLSKDDVSIMLSIPNEHLPFEKPAFTGSFYFHTDDVDGWWAKLKDRAKVCYEIENFDYGMREFAIFDNNGYVLQFGTPR